LRHSYAARLLESQVNPAFAAEHMGHSVEIYLRTYAKCLGGDRNKLKLEKLEKVDVMILAALANAAIASAMGTK